MSDIILQSQARHASRFFSDNNADILHTSSHNSISAPLSIEKVYVSPVGSTAFGQWVEFEIPAGYIGEMYLSTTLGALTSGNYCVYPGMSLIDEIELRSGSNTLQAFRYAPVMHQVLTEVSAKRVLMYQSVCGGTAHTSGSVVSPLPLFWTLTGNPKEEHMAPLNTNLSSVKLKLRVKFRSAADLAAAGATVGSPTISTRLYFFSYNTVSDAKTGHIVNKDSYVYKAIDFQTVAQSAAIATGTATTLNITELKGSLASISVFHKLVSNIDTAHSYLVDENDMTELKLVIDGRDYWVSDQDLEGDYSKTLMGATDGVTATHSDPSIIPFSYGNDSSNYTGGLEMASVNQLNLALKHSAGANCYLDVLAKRHCFFTVESGAFVRTD